MYDSMILCRTGERDNCQERFTPGHERKEGRQVKEHRGIIGLKHGSTNWGEGEEKKEQARKGK